MQHNFYWRLRWGDYECSWSWRHWQLFPLRDNYNGRTFLKMHKAYCITDTSGTSLHLFEGNDCHCVLVSIQLDERIPCPQPLSKLKFVELNLNEVTRASFLQRSWGYKVFVETSRCRAFDENLLSILIVGNTRYAQGRQFRTKWLTLNWKYVDTEIGYLLCLIQHIYWQS